MKAIFWAVLTIAVLAFGNALPVQADGIPLKGNHVDGEKTTLTLTNAQKRVIGKKPFATVSLTAQQQSLLKRDAGFAPKRIEVRSLADARESCTCEALNVAIATGRGKIEVVHFLLGSDLNDRFKHVRKQAAHKN